MIENKNTPEKFVKSDKLIAPKSRKNWDSVHSWTGSPGLFMPVKSWDLPKNASVSLRPLTQFETLPTVSPLKGHYIQRYEYFFCPYRLYLPNLINDNVNEIENIENMSFPLVGNSIEAIPEENINYSFWNNKFVVISNGHLFKYLGMPTLIQNFSPNDIAGLTAPFTSIYSIGCGPYQIARRSDIPGSVNDMLLPFATFFADNSRFLPIYKSLVETSENPAFFYGGSYSYTYNAVPFLAYIDIFMNFVANPSEKYVYNIGTSSITFNRSGGENVYFLTSELVSTPFSVMQAIVPSIRRSGYTFLHDVPNEDGVLADYYLVSNKVLPTLSDDANDVYLYLGFNLEERISGNRRTYNPFVSSSRFIFHSSLTSYQDVINTIVEGVDNGNIYNHEGMFLVPYLPDYFTTWLDPDDIQFSRQIVSSDMSVQSLRLAERKWADFGRQIVNRSKRYTSWLETAFGVNGPTLNMSTKPIWVGRDDIMVNFQNITSNAETDKTTYTGTLGSNVSRADFKTQYNDVKPIRFTTQEPGLLMCVSYIVPEVSYGKGVDKFLLKRKFGDLYRVPYDAIGFQTTDSRELDAGCSNPGINIGYNISWVEYMTKVNTHVGLFNTKSFRSWLLSRETVESDTVPMPGVPTKPDPWYLQNSTYIDPDMFNHSFVSIGQGTDNFIVQTLFNFECKLPMSNQILNTRW